MIRKIILWGLKRNFRGFGLLSKLFFTHGIITTNHYGVRLALNPYEKIDMNILRFGAFDRPVSEALLENLKGDDIFWDVGANIGIHSLAAKKKLPGIQCHCFEPYYKNFEKLVTNESLNNLSLEKYNFGLSEKSSVVELYTTRGNHGRTGFSSMAGSDATSISVLTISPDELIAHHGFRAPAVIKLDTEGHELPILRGSTTLLASPTLRTIVYESYEDKDLVADFLKRFNFAIRAIGDGTNFVATR